MKKNRNILAIIILFICLLACIIIKYVYKNNNELECDAFTYEDVLVEINTAVNNVFSHVDNMSSYIPLVFSSEADYIFAINEQNEKDYFVIIKNASEGDLSELINLVDITSGSDEDVFLEIKQYGIYTYVISSEKFSSTIDGIIRSYIYCN